MNKVMPVLYGLATNGKIKTVEYSVEELEDGSCDIVNVFGYLDGKKQTDRRNIREGKNIGKTNETSVYEQACLEMESKWRKKKDENYTENPTGICGSEEKSLLPMLAQKFTERKHHIKYPCLVQPKLNGLRCLAKKTNHARVNFTSRKYKPYKTIVHLEAECFSILNSMIGLNRILDGEIYKHGLTLQEINRRVKKYRPGLTEELEYWVYDIAEENMDNIQRRALMGAIDESNLVKVKILPTYVCNSEEEVKAYHDQFVQEGYEGVIIRNTDGMYLFEKRSNDLQKYKEFIDEEFEVVGYKSGEGREYDAIIFTCKVKNPKDVLTFDVRPRGSIEDRVKQMYDDPDKFIGMKYTVRYQDLSESNVPNFPVGICFRLEEDLPEEDNE